MNNFKKKKIYFLNKYKKNKKFIFIIKLYINILKIKNLIYWKIKILKVNGSPNHNGSPKRQTLESFYYNQQKN